MPHGMSQCAYAIGAGEIRSSQRASKYSSDMVASKRIRLFKRAAGSDLGGGRRGIPPILSFRNSLSVFLEAWLSERRGTADRVQGETSRHRGPAGGLPSRGTFGGRANLRGTVLLTRGHSVEDPSVRRGRRRSERDRTPLVR